MWLLSKVKFEKLIFKGINSILQNDIIDITLSTKYKTVFFFSSFFNLFRILVNVLS